MSLFHRIPRSAAMTLRAVPVFSSLPLSFFSAAVRPQQSGRHPVTGVTWTRPPFPSRSEPQARSRLR
jgi:hypothetical protein